MLPQDIRLRLVQVTRRPTEIRVRGAKIPDVERILVVRHDRLGDLVVSLPAVAAIRDTYPAARLGLLVAPRHAALGRLVEGVDAVLETDRRLAATLDAVRTFRPELVLCLGESAAMAWVALRAGARHRVGRGRRAYSALFTRRVGERRRRGERHEVEYSLSFAHAIGASAGEAAFPLRVDPQAVELAARWIEERRVGPGFVLIHPGSGGSSPAWPTAHYASLASELVRRGIDVVFSVGPYDGAIAATLDAAAPDIRGLPRSGHALPELVALIDRAGLVVGGSTGPLHLAAARSRPTLGLFPPWPTAAPERWGPYAATGWALVAEHEPARHWSRRQRDRRGVELLGAIGPSVVARVALALLAGRRPLAP